MSNQDKNNASNETVNIGEFVTFSAESVVQVKFEADLQSQYRPDQNVFVAYQVCNDFQPSSRDWIGLYPATNKGVQDYINFQWAPKQPRDDKFPNIRGVLFGAGEVDIKPSATNKYLFMYVSKAQHILAQSPTFLICDLEDDNIDLDIDDIEDFGFVKSKPDKETANFEVVRNWTEDAPRKESLPELRDAEPEDRVSLTDLARKGAGRTLLEIFATDDGDEPEEDADEQEDNARSLEKDQQQQLLDLSEKVKHDQEVELEALQVELEYVDQNLSQQTQAVKQLSAQVETLTKENSDLKVTNEMLFKTQRSLTNRKEAVEAKLASCQGQMQELRTVVRLQKKGNRNMEREYEQAKEQARSNANLIDNLSNDLKALKLERSELEDRLVDLQQMDPNGNGVTPAEATSEETLNTEEKDAGWKLANNRKTERMSRTIERLETDLAQEQGRCAEVEANLRKCEHQMDQLQLDAEEHQSEVQRLTELLSEEEKSSSELDSRVQSLTVELEKLRKDNERLDVEVTLLKRQKMRARRHLSEREEELNTKIQSLESALKTTRRINKKLKRQCDTAAPPCGIATGSKRSLQEANLTAWDEIETPAKIQEHQDLNKTPAPNKTRSWDNYFQSFVTTCQEAWNKGIETMDEIASSGGLAEPMFYSDPLFPFPVFPLADNEELAEMDEPLDLSIKRVADKDSSVNVTEPSMVEEIESACSSSDSPTSSEESSPTPSSSSSANWAEQFADFWALQKENEDMDEEETQLLDEEDGWFDPEDLDHRAHKKMSARKTAAFLAFRQPKQQDGQDSSDPEEPKKVHPGRKLVRKFITHSRRFHFPGKSNNRHTVVKKGNLPMSPLTK